MFGRSVQVVILVFGAWEVLKICRNKLSRKDRMRNKVKQEVEAELQELEDFARVSMSINWEPAQSADDPTSLPSTPRSIRANGRLYGLLTELKRKVNEEDGGFPEGAVINGDVDKSFLRFLVAAEFDVDVARSNISEMRKWREENKIDDIFSRMLPNEKLMTLRECLPSSYHGFDRDGNPIHLEQTGQFNFEPVLTSFTADDLLRMHVIFMEYQSKILFPRASKRSGHMVDKMTNILDLRGLRISVLSNRQALSIFKEVQRIDQTYYPETLAKTVIVNANWVFRAAWKVLQVVFPKREQKKMVLLGGGNRLQERLLEIIDAQNLPSFLGGDCECPGRCISGPLGTGIEPSRGQEIMKEDLDNYNAKISSPSSFKFWQLKD